MEKKLRPGESRAVTITVYRYRCARCDHEGLAMPFLLAAPAEPPKRCSSCKSPYWMDPPGVRPRGRPKKTVPGT